MSTLEKILQLTQNRREQKLGSSRCYWRNHRVAILYTSGTTGTSKGAMLSHANIQTALFNVAPYKRSSQNDRTLCFLSLNHVFGQIHITHSMVL